jgi:DNA-binding transcriptional ArsR family regulator
MREHYDIETVEQMRAMADLLRIRIIDLLRQRAMTVTQLGEVLGLTPAKVHYHVRELERVGLLELVETREKGGILEKYYQPIAYEISVNRVLLSASRDESQAMLRALFDQLADGYLSAFRRAVENQDVTQADRMVLFLSHLSMTGDEQRQLFAQIDELLKPFEQKREGEDIREVVFSTFVYPPGVGQGEARADLAAPQINWSVGAVSYSRQDLLKARAAGTRLRISVVGVCHFASDIDAALVEQTVESFKLVGKLTASPEVKRVLRHKEEQA